MSKRDSTPADSVTITPAKVGIQCLYVGGKQMTQSIFKQIPERGILNDMYGFHGTPWGRVRYRYHGINVWVLWEDEGILYKSAIPHKPVLSDIGSVSDLSRRIAFFEAFYDELTDDDLWELESLQSDKGQAEFEIDRAHKIDELRSELLRLPQLFIAV